jgi:hypothetical protein
VILGWSAGGHNDLRATDDDRESVLRLLDMAYGEGRLDSVEHARRADAIHASKTRKDLVALTADLPNQRGVREWIDDARIRADDRDRAVGWLAEAASLGRLTTAGYQERVSALSEVATYTQLKRVLDGVHGVNLLAGTADREAALASLTEAVADGRVPLTEYAAFDAEIRRAERVGDLGALHARLDTHASDQERLDTAWEVEAAHLDGRLDAGERAARLDGIRTAARDDDLADLMRDLRGPARRMAEADWEEVAARLKQALDQGRLELDEYDSRLRAAMMATTLDEAAPLLADLTDPPRPPWRGPLDVMFDFLVVNSALLPAPRDRWRRVLSAKVIWKANAVAISLLYGWLVVNQPVAAVLLPLWPVAIGISAMPFAMGLRGVAEDGQRSLVAELRASLSRYEHPGLRFMSPREIESNGALAGIEIHLVDEDADTIPAELVEEAVRQIWLSRDYPLTYINLYVGSSWTAQRMKITRAERRRLRHLHGPRPYGPLPARLATVPSS